VAGTAVFAVVNAASLACILLATGNDVRHAIFDGLEIRVLLVGAALSIGLVTALAISVYPMWALPIAVIPLLVLRQVLAGHFGARQDRARLNGLFQATLEANQSMGSSDVEQVILRSATELLRCSGAALADAPLDDGLNVQVASGERSRWLTVSERSRTEPFDGADRALLEALGAVGAGALANAQLYEEVRYQRERLGAITASLGEGVCALDRDARVMFVNPAAEQMLGWGEEELRSMSPDSPVAWSEHPLDFLVGPAVRAMQNRTSIRSEDALFLKRDGTSFPVAFTASPIVDNDEVAGAVVAFRDITERRAFEEQLTRHAFHDALTGLPNRRLFLDHLDRALARQARSSETHAVVFADIDRFKVINDSLGHQAGDALLIAIAERMANAVRPGDVLARFGGDEFTMLLTDISSAADAVSVAERLTDLLRAPVALGDGHEVVPTVSIGIALTTEGKSRDDVLHDADVAMYKAKVRGRSGYYEVFDSAAMGARSAEWLDLETALRRALDDRTGLEVYYQPLFSSRGQEIVGVEALVRWSHPQRGLLLPSQFIELAEDTGLILPLGRFVLEQACRQAQDWTDAFGLKLSMSVNLSARQFQQQGLAEDVESILRATRVKPAQMCLEITETLAMIDVDRTISVLHRLKALGVRLAIDDFGTGYSSLGYLKRFPIDVVKIDRSFVDGLQTNAVDSAIVAAVINLTEAIGMTAVAEGVETSRQLEHLRSLRCPVVQGFLLARPMPASAVTELLQQRTGTPIADAALAHSAPVR
jgi:Amt family ammonium transporter